MRFKVMLKKGAGRFQSQVSPLKTKKFQLRQPGLNKVRMFGAERDQNALPRARSGREFVLLRICADLENLNCLGLLIAFAHSTIKIRPDQGPDGLGQRADLMVVQPIGAYPSPHARTFADDYPGLDQSFYLALDGAFVY